MDQEGHECVHGYRQECVQKHQCTYAGRRFRLFDRDYGQGLDRNDRQNEEAVLRPVRDGFDRLAQAEIHDQHRAGEGGAIPWQDHQRTRHRDQGGVPSQGHQLDCV